MAHNISALRSPYWNSIRL